ncbi:MAG: nitrous oxide-stimulated promoter family protein [Candidatus Lokiarchaeia archaeon]|nr:nitrous oxide-stimulated promoter family protein [Candidatus Lokiarchaeia archaeon]
MTSHPINHLKEERKTIETMIKMYCRNTHDPKDEICEECLTLLEYANKRLDHCRFGENKPTCEKCPIHCYKPEMREKVRKIMRYAGPRMIYRHPIMGFRHLFKKLRKFDNSF